MLTFSCADELASPGSLLTALLPRPPSLCDDGPASRVCAVHVGDATSVSASATLFFLLRRDSAAASTDMATSVLDIAAMSVKAANAGVPPAAVFSCGSESRERSARSSSSLRSNRPSRASARRFSRCELSSSSASSLSESALLRGSAHVFACVYVCAHVFGSA